MLGYNIYKGLENRVYVIPPAPQLPKVVVKSSEDIINMIFSVDPDTLLITSDITHYLGNKTAPEVKQFIQSELMRESSEKSPISLPTDSLEQYRNIPDDLRVELMRGEFETVEDYQERIMSKLNSYKQEIYNKKLIAEYESRQQKRS